MRKIMSTMLCLMVVLTLSTCAYAETWSHEASGITVELAEGMSGEDISEDDIVGLAITDEDEASPVYFVFMEYDEDFAETWMQDLEEESIQSIAEAYAAEDSNYAFELMEAGDSPLIVMADEENTEAMVIALLNGWFVSVEALAPEGMELAEGAYEDIVAILAGISLPEA